MPIYEYHCTGCDKTFEKISKTSDSTLPCPNCGQLAAKAISIPSPGHIASGSAASGPPPCAASCGKTSGFG
jgi:putative FmdB family regulatory protein